MKSSALAKNGTDHILDMFQVVSLLLMTRCSGQPVALEGSTSINLVCEDIREGLKCSCKKSVNSRLVHPPGLTLPMTAEKLHVITVSEIYVANSIRDCQTS